MKPAHTPGPWIVRPNQADKLRGLPVRSYEVLAKDNGVYKPYVADVRSLDRNGQDNSETNARLVAAAPCLQRALLDLLGDLGGCPGVMHLRSIHAAREAIARAKEGV